MPWPGDLIQHRPTTQWPIKLRGGPGFVEWVLFGKRVARDNPAALVLGRALLSLIGVEDFNLLVQRADVEEIHGVELIRLLGGLFLRSAPPSWQRALSLLAFVANYPRDHFESTLSGTSSTENTELSIDRLVELGLVEERNDSLSVAPSIIGMVDDVTEEDRVSVLPALAERILRPVNSLGSLIPEDARRVLHAHAIYVALSDFSAAERTARLHLHGLVDLARRTSLGGARSAAWRQYDAIYFMLRSGGWQAQSVEDRRTRSYVVHYRTWNGSAAGHLDPEETLLGYRSSAGDWPENALWWQRTLQSLLRLGRLTDFHKEFESAYANVPPHPRRDEILRIRPAETALEQGQPELSLELLEPTLELRPDEHPTVVDRRDAILRRWSQGVAMSELSYPTGRLLFFQAHRLRITQTGRLWRAVLSSLDVSSEGETPLGALWALGNMLGTSARGLVSIPSTRLSAPDVRRKGFLLAQIDVLNSDIGLPHQPDRWLVGRIEQDSFLPVMLGMDPIEIPYALQFLRAWPHPIDSVYIAGIDRSKRAEEHEERGSSSITSQGAPRRSTPTPAPRSGRGTGGLSTSSRHAGRHTSSGIARGTREIRTSGRPSCGSWWASMWS
jgi:hypothetical protein